MFSLFVGWALIFHKYIAESLVNNEWQSSTRHLLVCQRNTSSQGSSIPINPRCLILVHHCGTGPDQVGHVLWPCGWHFLKETGSHQVPKKGKIRLLAVPSTACPAHIPLRLHQAVSCPMMLSYRNRGSWTKDSLMMRWKRWSQGCCKRAKAQHVMDKSWSDIQLGCLDSIVLITTKINTWKGWCLLSYKDL